MISKVVIEEKIKGIKALIAKVTPELTEEQGDKLITCVLSIDFWMERFDRVALKHIMGECGVIDRIVEEHCY